MRILYLIRLLKFRNLYGLLFHISTYLLYRILPEDGCFDCTYFIARVLYNRYSFYNCTFSHFKRKIDERLKNN